MCILHISVSQEFVVYHHDHRQNENDVAEQLVGFLQQFLEVFSELKGKNFYPTGENVSSVGIFRDHEFNLMLEQYAGMYVSCMWWHSGSLSLSLC